MQQYFKGGSRIVPMMLVIAMLWLGAACAPIVPAQTPPQLEFTPGASVRVDDVVYDAGDFKIDYPQGWRIVKSNTAEAPMSVVFVSPDETMAIYLSADSQAEFTLPEDHTESKTRRIELDNGQTVMVGGSATFEAWHTLTPIYERIVASVSS